MPLPTASSGTTTVGLTSLQNIDALLGGMKWGGAVGTGTILTYSFPWASGGGAVFSGPNGVGNYSLLNEPNAAFVYALNAAEQAAARVALQSWSNVANVGFQEVVDTAANVGDIRFAWTSVPNLISTGGQAWGWGGYPDPNFPAGGDIWISTLGSGATDPNWSAGSFNCFALIHEIGHVLGLKHPFEAPTLLPASLDTNQYSVMSYTAPANNLFRTITYTATGIMLHTSQVPCETPMVLDIAAIQHLYGANMAFHAGDDVYSFDALTPFFKTIWDAGGNDTISVSNFVENCCIDLTPGNYSSIRILSAPIPAGYTIVGGIAPTYDGANNLGIAYGAIIENAIGGSGNDLLTGNDAANSLDGGAGNDTLSGAAGNDVFIFASSGNGLDTITDFSVGDNIVVAGAVFSGTVVAGNGSTVLANQIQLLALGGATTLFIGTDSIAGADIQIQLTGSYLANSFSLNTNNVFINSTPTGIVTITGVATQGQILTASNTLADADGLGVISYQWLAGGINILGATGSTYTLTQAEVGKVISVIASYTDQRGTAEAVTSSVSANVSALLVNGGATTSRYTLLGAGANFMDFYVPYGNLSLDGQNIVLKGNSGIDTVYVGSANGLSFDFTQAGLGVDQIYLSGNWADYSRSFSGSVVTLVRIVGGGETIKTISGDNLIFADGAVPVLNALNFLKGLAAEPVPAGTASTAFPITVTGPLNNTVRVVVQDASGETIALNRPGVSMIAKGSSGVDVIYALAGASIDGTQLGLGQDKLYLTGNFADYGGAFAGSVVTLTRALGANTETVKFLGGSVNAFDSIVFADGAASSIDILNFLKGIAAAPALNTTEVSPLGTGNIITGTTGADILNGVAAGDTLYGYGGADIINGFAGNDTIVISDAGATALNSATLVFSAVANGTDTVIGFGAAPVASGGDVLDFSAIANLADAVATGQTLTTAFAASNVFIFDAAPVSVTAAASAIAASAFVTAADGFIVIADAANGNAVTVYHCADLAGNTGAATALAILFGVNITSLTAANFLV